MLFRKMLRTVLLGFLLVMGGTIAYFLLGSSNHQLNLGEISLTDPDVDLKIENMHVVQNTNGVREWELWADSAKVYREKGLTLLKNLRLRVYPKEGESAYVTAKEGTMQNESRNIRINGNVTILASNGVSMKTDSLYFRSKEKRIDSDSQVLMEGARFRLIGTGLQGQTDLGNYKLQEKVSATIYGASGYSFKEEREKKLIRAN
ncbi:MAG: LPS export ABC transporter periplasmic protein LptC [Nitrospinae bacterium]|nr:LPS export ABC transporter periplasmic protein LptC [Nitrospinota bacterium]